MTLTQLRHEPAIGARDIGRQAPAGRLDVIACPQCRTANRVPAAAAGVPHCGRCHDALPWLTTATDDDVDAVVGASTLPVLVSVWAPWEPWYWRTAPGVDRAATAFAGSLKVVQVNVDTAAVAAMRLAALSVPMLLLLEHGAERGKLVGALGPYCLREWVRAVLDW